MKDLKKTDKGLFRMDMCAMEPEELLERLQVALEFLWEDDELSMHDKVVGDFDYEELIAVLLWGEAIVEGYFATYRD